MRVLIAVILAISAAACKPEEPEKICTTIVDQKKREAVFIECVSNLPEAEDQIGRAVESCGYNAYRISMTVFGECDTTTKVEK